MSTAPPLHIPGARLDSQTPPPISPNATGYSSKNPFRRQASDSSQGSFGSYRQSSYGSVNAPSTIRSVSDQRSNSPFEPPQMAPPRDQRSPFGGSDLDVYENPGVRPQSFADRAYTTASRNTSNRMSTNPFLVDLSPPATSPAPHTSYLDYHAGNPNPEPTNSNVAANQDWSQPSSAPPARTRFNQQETASAPSTRRRTSTQRPLTYYAAGEDDYRREKNDSDDFVMSNRKTTRPRSSSDLNGRDLPSYDEVLEDAPPRTFGNEYGRDEKDSSRSAAPAPPAPRSRRTEPSSHETRSHSHSHSREERRRNPETPDQRRARKEREYEKFKRYQERKDREASVKAGQRSKGGARSKTGQPLDTIDKLDVTGFGFGSGFHHDGPFDACRPHRNTRTNVKAPVAAFPVNGANNALGPAKPQDDQIDAWGRTENEAFSDFSAPHMAPSGPQVARDPQSGQTRFDPTNRSEVHGAASQGLGTSTFLDGAPASQADIEASHTQTEGITRKKSLVQRLRKGAVGSSPPPRPNDASKIVYRTYSNDSDMQGRSSGKEYYGERSSAVDQPESNGLLRRVKSLKVTRRRS